MTEHSAARDDSRKLGWGYARLSPWLASARAPGGVALLALIMSLPALSLGMIGDDYDLAVQVERHPLRAYVFQELDPTVRQREIVEQRAMGELPWWTADDFHLAFMRPLASLSHALDFALFPHAPWLMHLENSLLFAGIVLLASRLYRHLGWSSTMLGWATLFFALQGGHSMTVAFIAGRNTLLAVAFGLLALLFDLRAGRASLPRVRGSLRVLAALSFACALLSGELGVSALGYLLSAACCLDQGTLRDRALRVAPYLSIVCAWQVAYHFGGYGVLTTAYYRHPLTDPDGYMLGLLAAVPIYLASVLTVPFGYVADLARHAMPVCALLSLAILWLARNLLLPPLRADAHARYLALGALLATFPLGASLPQDRLVFFVSFGVAPLLARLIVERFETPHPGASPAGAIRLFRMHTLYALPLFFYFLLFALTSSGFGGGARLLAATLPGPSDRSILLLNAPSHFPVHFQRLMRAREGVPSAPAIDLLYAGSAPLTLRRTGERSLELTIARGMFASPLERTVRDPAQRPFRAGDVTSLERLRVTVLAVDSYAAPTRVRFALTASGPLPRLMSWSKSGAVERPWPAIGDALTLPALTAL